MGSLKLKLMDREDDQKPPPSTFVEKIGKPDGVADAELEIRQPRDLPRAADFDDKRPNLGKYLQKFPGGIEIERNPAPSRDIDCDDEKR